MKTVLKHGTLLVALMSLALTGFSDTLLLKNGDEIIGYYEGGTSRVIRFRTDAGVQEYDLLRVAGIEFGGDVVDSTPRTANPPLEATIEAPAERLDEPIRLQTFRRVGWFGCSHSSGSAPASYRPQVSGRRS